MAIEPSDGDKPFLGGYRDKRDGTEYLHATAQTYTRPYRTYSYGECY